MSLDSLPTDVIVAGFWGFGSWYFILNIFGNGQTAVNVGLLSFLILLMYFYTKN